MTKENPLSRFKFFSGVAPETLEIIAQKGEIREFDAGAVVFHCYEPAEHLYGLLEGEVDLSLVFKDKVLKTEIEYEEAIQATFVDEEKSIVVDTVRERQVFGWASLVGPGHRTVTARCTKPCRVIVIPAAELKAMFEEDHFLGYTIMEKLCNVISRRLEKRTDKLIETWGEAFDVNRI
jgi:CRP-like cAMP-binding protein